MKKILSFLLIATLAVVGFINHTAYAEEGGLIDIYPYGDLGSLTGIGVQPGHSVTGDSHWNIIYNGYRYNVVRGNVRFASEANDGEGFFYDKDANGSIEAVELPTLPWNAFGSLYINDTDLEFELATVNARVDLSVVAHRMYVYWDENGLIKMFEDHISTYLIINDNYNAEAEKPNDPQLADYRFATAAEAVLFDANPGDHPEMSMSHIRAIRDEVDTNGYVIEPLGYLSWKHRDLSASTKYADWSVLLDYNPENVVIPAGWSVFSFGTRDRGYVATEEVNHVAWLKSLPIALAEKSEEAAIIEYETPAPTFGSTLSAALDNDGSVPGIQKLIGKNESFELPNTVKATWVNMFDENGKIQNKVEELDYTVEFFEDGNLLETVTFTWDGTAYTADKQITSFIDSTDINNRYELKYHVTAPDAQTYDVDVDVAVGYYPPKFSNVGPRFVAEDIFVDLLGEITAENGYGLDVTEDIKITHPTSLNPYYPQPGSYKIEFEVTYNHHVPAVPHSLSINGVAAPFNKAHLNAPSINGYAYSATQKFIVYNDTAAYKTAMLTGASWGTVMTVIAADGTVKEAYDRFNWNYIAADGTSGVGDETLWKAWIAGVELGEGEFGLASHGSANAGPLRSANLHFGDPVIIDLGVDEVNDKVTTNTSYILTVDDTTAPVGIVVDNNYSVSTGQFETADAAILANVVAIDNHDSPKDLTIYVEDDGGLKVNEVGTHMVVVGIEDAMGNYASVSFSVKVVAAKVSTAELDALQTALEAQIAALQTLLEDADAADKTALLASLTTLQTTLQGQITALETALKAADAADKASLLATIATLQGLVDGLEDDLATLQTSLSAQAAAIAAIEASLEPDAKTGCGKTASVSSLIGLSLVSISFLSTLAFFFIKKRY